MHLYMDWYGEIQGGQTVITAGQMGRSVWHTYLSAERAEDAVMRADSCFWIDWGCFFFLLSLQLISQKKNN